MLGNLVIFHERVQHGPEETGYSAALRKSVCEFTELIAIKLDETLCVCLICTTGVEQLIRVWTS